MASAFFWVVIERGEGERKDVVIERGEGERKDEVSLRERTKGEKILKM